MPNYLYQQPIGFVFKKPRPNPSRAHMDILRKEGIRVQPLSHANESRWVATGDIAQIYRSERNQYGREHNNDYGTTAEEKVRESAFLARQIQNGMQQPWVDYYQ